MDKHKVRDLVHCYGQFGYRAQVPQYPINSYKYISSQSSKSCLKDRCHNNIYKITDALERQERL